MPRIPRFRRKQDPRRPPQAIDEVREEAPTEGRSYGQYLEPEGETDDLKEFEETTDEVARENGSEAGNLQSRAEGVSRDDVEEREEFEDLTGEVTREENDEKS